MHQLGCIGTVDVLYCWKTIDRKISEAAPDSVLALKGTVREEVGA